VIVRRFVFVKALDRVVELGQHVISVQRPGDEFKDAKAQHAVQQNESAGLRLRNAALEIADRRLSAHKRTGDERRWRE